MTLLRGSLPRDGIDERHLSFIFLGDTVVVDITKIKEGDEIVYKNRMHSGPLLGSKDLIYFD